MSLSGFELPSGRPLELVLHGARLVRSGLRLIVWRLAWRSFDLRGDWVLIVTWPDGSVEQQLAIVERQLGVRAAGRLRSTGVAGGNDVTGRVPLEYDLQLRWETKSTISYQVRGQGGRGEGQVDELGGGFLREVNHGSNRAFEGLAVATASPGGALVPIQVRITGKAHG